MTFIRSLALVAALAGYAMAGVEHPPAKVQKTGPDCAVLAAGQMSVQGSKRFGVADKITIVKLNTHAHEDYDEAIHKMTGPAELQFLYISGTPYAFILAMGSVQPLVLDWGKWEVWRIDGLGKYFSKSKAISPGEKSVTFGFGMADLDLRWSFDFSDKARGVVITFDRSGGF